MIPIRDENRTRHTPWLTIVLIGAIVATWIFVQGAGFDSYRLAASVCDLGLVAGELTRLAPPGTAVPLGKGLACVVDREPLNWVTPITSMFLHGGWMHLAGNLLFFWVFGNNVEDAFGSRRFFVFYFVCGLIAALAQVALDPSSAVPMVGASGAISGVMGAYLVLYPRTRVHMLFIFIIFFKIIPLPAWLVLLWWFALQLLGAMPMLAGTQNVGGVAVMAHIGGFLAGVYLTMRWRGTRQPPRWERARV